MTAPRQKRPSVLERLRATHIETISITFNEDGPQPRLRARYGLRTAGIDEPGLVPDESWISHLRDLVRGSRQEVEQALELEWPRLRDEWFASRRRAVLDVVDKSATWVGPDEINDAYNAGVVRSVHES